jgi:hypothetical protein
MEPVEMTSSCTRPALPEDPIIGRAWSLGVEDADKFAEEEAARGKDTAVGRQRLIHG